MKVVCHLLLAAVLLAIILYDNAGHAAPACSQQEIEAHVRQQYAVYGPRSEVNEYFGFIYLHDGVIASAVVRSRTCGSTGRCVVDSNDALRLVPRPAKVLGEWHTHPHGGSTSLSRDDVRGAFSNRRIDCYFAFYSTPSGEIYAWNPKQVSVPVAMGSRTRVGQYINGPLRDSGVVAMQ
jgi:hypothetical protein